MATESRSAYFDLGPIWALATPPGVGAIAVVRLSGEGCIAKLATVFSRPGALMEAPTHTVVHGRLLSNCRDGVTGIIQASTTGAQQNVIDECLVTVFREGHGYTGEEAAEISLHGSPSVVRAVGVALEAAGFRHAERGEFTFRAVRNGRLSLYKAEAVNRLIHSKTEVARESALGNLGGALDKRISALGEQMKDLEARFALELDYSDSDFDEDTTFPQPLVDSIRTELERMKASYGAFHLRAEGVKVVLSGQTNAGKSTIFNALLRSDRAIVSPEPGTTRDYIEAELDFGGTLVRLFDTAGFNSGAQGAEVAGIAATRALIDTADVVVRVADCQSETEVRTLVAEAEQYYKRAEQTPKTIFALTKCSLPGAKPGLETACSSAAGGRILRVSAAEGVGIGDLCRAIKHATEEVASDAGGTADAQTAAPIQSEMQKAWVGEALDLVKEITASQPVEINASLIHEARGKLEGDINLRADTEEILGRMFAKFCVGK